MQSGEVAGDGRRAGSFRPQISWFDHDAAGRFWEEDGAVTRLVIDVERSDNPILGTVRKASEPDRPFAGWIGLLAALEAALETDRQGGEAAAPPESRG